MTVTETPTEIVARVREVAALHPGEYPDLSTVSDERIIEVASRPGALRGSWFIADAAVTPDPEVLVHPATLLRERAEAMTRSIAASVAERMATFTAATVLREHEADHGVTFLPVKTTDLDAARALVDAGLRGAATRQDPQAIALYDALAALLAGEQA